MKKYLNLSAIFLLIIGAAGVGWGELTPELKIPESDIIFSHRLHVTDQEVDCETCHGTINSSRLAADKNLPTMDECGNCHDVGDVDKCGTCHKNADDPQALANPAREIIFSHQKHLEMKTECRVCHRGIESAVGPDPSVLPRMSYCFECHDGKKASNECGVCHSSNLTLLSIHPVEWKHQHGDRAATDQQWCAGCHNDNSFCLNCHRGDNLIGEIHDLNYIYTHGLDAKSKAAECARCHDNQAFCVDCHDRGGRMPMRHSTLSWGTEHGRYAREDVENCASCHEEDDPTCARAGCHNDFDGIKGTDTRIHRAEGGQLDFHGPWHSDDSYYCYQCHVPTHTPGSGFCGYCHD